ncbi:phage integrase SAM-like domain-containing protein [Domibacillus tundrae]|uniref:phage integrase SAM-like domain-containing protein n=1 Tax=Domibacillus tundrae TaxID=1587527 RepID=UPI00061801AC|nr:phage integrase SAM-like domain-containing protein [Domibacillus tundrae]
MEGLSKHTLTNYNKLFNNLERCFAKNKYMENFTIEDARRFIEWQLHEKQQFKGVRWDREKKIGVNITSANSYLRLAKAAFSCLIEEGHLQKNPFPVLRILSNNRNKWIHYQIKK